MSDSVTPDRISAVVVVRNGERFLADALHSIAQQTRPPDEILVIDGQSTDGTAAIALRFPGVRYLLQTELGIANARNLAIACVDGEFVAFLDADDLWTPNKLAVQFHLMLANPHLMYTTSLLTLFYEPGCPPRPGFRAEGFTQGIEGRFPGTMLARREVFRSVGLFDPMFSVAFEVDWFARAQDLRTPSAVIDKVLLHKRIHTENNAIQRQQFRREWFVVMRRSLARKRLIDQPTDNAARQPEPSTFAEAR